MSVFDLSSACNSPVVVDACRMGWPLACTHWSTF